MTPGPATAVTDSSRRLRLAVLGCGDVLYRYYYLPTLQRLVGVVDLVALIDRTRTRLNAAVETALTTWPAIHGGVRVDDLLKDDARN